MNHSNDEKTFIYLVRKLNELRKRFKKVRYMSFLLEEKHEDVQY